MIIRFYLFVSLLQAAFSYQTYPNPDWLVSTISHSANVSTTSRGNLIIQNSLITREFSIKPDFTTVDYYSFDKEASILRALGPEAVISLDGITYFVGHLNTSTITRGYLNRTELREKATYDVKAFHFSAYRITKPEEPFPYKPKRGAPEDIVWPPAGVRLEVDFKAPNSAPDPHKGVLITISYELYDGVPILSKKMRAKTLSEEAESVNFSLLSLEFLAVNSPWASRNWHVDTQYGRNGYGWMHVETDWAHGTQVVWSDDPSQPSMPGSFMPTLNVSFSPPAFALKLDKEGFESFSVRQLVHASDDDERIGLSKRRMLRLLAPHTQENPIFFHMVDSKSVAVRSLIDQMAEVGFEMLLYSFGSGFDLESEDPAYIKSIAEDIAYAHAKGIEVGGYDLIALSRRTIPKYMALDETGNSTDSTCFASEWYDVLLEKMISFMDKTGLSAVETDGPYGGYSCSSKNHKYHRNNQDSVYRQQKKQGEMYRLLRRRTVYINQPDNYFYDGGSKTGMGYNENQYSLPRWQDISISRQTVFDNTFLKTPTVGWMHVPLVQYHGGGAAAIFEPLTQHSLEYKWALEQYLGAGVAACYRGYRLFDSNTTKRIVKETVDFYKTYRQLLISDIIHVRRPDMQSIDAYLHVNPKLKDKALLMAFNPTESRLRTTMTIPLYYTGLTKSCIVSERGGKSCEIFLSRDYTIRLDIELNAYSITWYVIN
ncbi:unnamed protein product [Dimorphilus gyrociliatus]|uniref:Uncharacterized protein n=1 Tax=Dimorphilus gyrociliatus TaxID=2664684 RepID=A0A7I8VL82_9ANNE|nr:unnamed protein product [Dimorphilus gyrociliatus]